MAENSKIEWTDATWTPIRAMAPHHEKGSMIGWHCEKVDAGCDNCYAQSINLRLGTQYPFKPGHLKHRNKFGEPRGDVSMFLDEKMLTAPLRWRKTRMIFVCSMTDLFADFVPDEWVDKVFAVMALCPQHTFQCLTKRPDRAGAYLSDAGVAFRVAKAMDTITAKAVNGAEVIVPVDGFPGYFASNLGVIYSDQRGRRRALRPDIGEAGHRRVQLSRDGVKTRFLLHRLLLETFVGPPPSETSEGRHLDGDPSHNTVANLAWGEPGTNWDDSKRHGSHRRYSKLTPEQAADIRSRHAKGESGEALAREFGISATQIRNIARGDQWSVKAPIEWPLASVWLGTSCSDQASADARIPDLLAAPAAVRFLSAEPLLGPMDLVNLHPNPMMTIDALGGRALSRDGDYDDGLARLDWVIVGGESGPNARVWSGFFDAARSLRDQCQSAGVPFFMKQTQGPTKRAMPPIPDDLMIREYPDAR
jgi:protein gp37